MYREFDDDMMKIMLEEDLIAANVKKFNMLVSEYMDEDLEKIDEMVLNLEKTENIDSVGVTFVIGLYKRAEKGDMEFRIVGASEEVVQLFKLMKLEHLIDED